MKLTYKETKELYIKNFVNKGGKLRGADEMNIRQQVKEFGMALKMEKIISPNLSTSKLIKRMRKSVSYNENYNPQLESENSLVNTISKALRRNNIFLKETRIITEKGKTIKRSVFAKLKAEDITYLSSGKTTRGRSYTAFKVVKGGKTYFVAEFISIKTDTGAEFVTFESKEQMLLYIKSN